MHGIMHKVDLVDADGVILDETTVRATTPAEATRHVIDTLDVDPAYSVVRTPTSKPLTADVDRFTTTAFTLA
jgi:hypothetical protein